MVSSAATTVADYIAEQQPEARDELQRIKDFCLQHLPAGLEEAMNWGMIVYQVPLTTLPNTHNQEPLAYAALAKQKHHFSLYLMSIYADEKLRADFETSFRAAGKKLDVGKSCVRFKSMADLDLPSVAKALSAVSVSDFVANYLLLKGKK